jgi:hypothetical protein
MSPSTRASLRLYACMLVLSGCELGEDSHRVHKLDRDGGEALLDSGRPNGAGDGAGGGAGEGGSGGSVLDGSISDAGWVTLPDGRIIGDDEDGGAGFAPEIDVSACSIANDESFEIAVPFVRDGFAIAAGHTDFGLAHLRDAQCKHGIDAALVSSSSGIPTPHTVMEGCDTMRDVTLTGLPDGYQLAWTDNATNTIELHTLKLDAKLEAADDAERTTLTQNALFERSPVAAALNGEPVIAWVGDASGKRRILVQRPGGTAVEPVPESAGREPIELAFGQVGPEHLVLAWVEEVANRGIWLLPLTGDGAALGEPTQLTNFAAPGSTVDVAGRVEDGGAVVYSVGIDQTSFEVRWRRLWADGTQRGEEVKVVSSPLQGKDASIARLGGGYVIAYRAIPDGRVVTEPEIRLAFVSKDGNLSKDPQGRLISFPVVSAARDGSPIQAEISVDGQLLLAFVDGSDSEENVLRVVRRRLDCPL